MRRAVARAGLQIRCLVNPICSSFVITIPVLISTRLLRETIPLQGRMRASRLGARPQCADPSWRNNAIPRPPRVDLLRRLRRFVHRHANERRRPATYECFRVAFGRGGVFPRQGLTASHSSCSGRRHRVVSLDGRPVQKAMLICDRGSGLIVYCLSITSIDQLPKSVILIFR